MLEIMINKFIIRNFVLLKNFHKINKFLCHFLCQNLSKNNVNTVNLRFLATSHDILYDTLKLRDKNTSNSIIDSKIKDLCIYYKCLNKEEKKYFILELACNYAVQHLEICKISKLLHEKCSEYQSIKIEQKLKNALTPRYKWLFIHVGRQENGVKFLVDMRIDILDLLQETLNSNKAPSEYLKQLNNTLRDLFLLWFSVGFLQLERLTWKSSCEMLQKISDYEAVHPVRNWADLKKRMGPDRRCFVYTHKSMPDEPLVILHTALRQKIVNSTAGLIVQNVNNEEVQKNVECFCSEDVKAAIFYSISSTQVGLQGIELGNYLIKKVANELAKEFPTLELFSSLSPIPKFKNWLFDILKRSNNNFDLALRYFAKDELESLECILKTNNVFIQLMKSLNSNNWLQISNLAETLQPIIMRNCVRYLYLEKKRGYALDSVANFHLRNGAEMWRINWMADLSARGLSTSCGIMVNYRYYLDQADNNSKLYIENKEIVISPLIENLLETYNLR